MLRGAAAWVGGAAAFVLAFGVLWNRIVVPAWRGGRSMWRKLDTLHDLAVRELNHNGGDSLKDHAVEGATQGQLATQSVINLAQRVERLEGELLVGRDSHQKAHRRLNDRLRSIERHIKERLT